MAAAAVTLRGGRGRPVFKGHPPGGRFSGVSPGNGERPFSASLPKRFRGLSQGIRKSLPAQAVLVNGAVPEQPKIKHHGPANPAKNNAQTQTEKNSVMDIIFPPAGRGSKEAATHRSGQMLAGASFLLDLFNNSWEPAGNWQKCLFCHRQKCLSHPLTQGRTTAPDAQTEPWLSGKGPAWLRQTPAN